MKDRNGVIISLGQKAVLLKRRDDLDLNGRIGEVRGFSNACGGNYARIASGPVGDPDWSTWARADEVVVIESERGQ